MDTSLYHNKESTGEPTTGEPTTGEPTLGGTTVGGSATIAPTERTTIRRLPDRGRYERGVIDAILDEAFICHVGIATERGPVVIPTTYARQGDQLYVHGSPASHLLRTMKGGAPVCLTVTLVDGLVLAKSTLHHSVNYRSVVVYGIATEVADLEERAAALAAIVEHIVPGRTHEVRAATQKEVRGTSVLCLSLDEASAKVRTGPPVDDEADLGLPVWSGVVPLALVAGAPLVDAHTDDSVTPSRVVTAYARPT
jgi:nitroimidazol reductase NimA-like FMN-containing flavoprotein (pyridoxamine 5'-phosphate oxidase superfamily)